MPEPISVRYSDDEEHLVRRLGCAVAYYWDLLPDEAKGRVLEGAVFVSDREPTVQLKEHLTMFIGKHKMPA